jgi:hypothetical protein
MAILTPTPEEVKRVNSTAVSLAAGRGAGVANLNWTSDQNTIDPALTLSGGAPSPDWLVTEGDGSTFTYSTASFSHTRTDPGAMTVELRNSSALAPYVTEIDFRGDGITSALSDMSVTQFTNLTLLYLHNNSLSGSIPTEIGNLTNLTQLRLHHNSLSGSIPTEIGNLTNLTLLYLYNNSLSGSIPTEIGNLTNLTLLYLYSNSLSGSIPTEIGNLTNLTQLRLHDNSLSGSIPTEIGNLTNLTLLYLYDNSLSGSIPTEIGNLTNLTQLRLHNNSLSGVESGALQLLAADDIQLQDNGMSESVVDDALWDIYQTSRTATNGSINVGGSNAAPSGTHQAAASCPVDASTPGKEVAHELVNDGCGAGFNTWTTVTFTA